VLCEWGKGVVLAGPVGSVPSEVDGPDVVVWFHLDMSRLYLVLTTIPVS
jgi:hypothetical protein